MVMLKSGPQDESRSDIHIYGTCVSDDVIYTQTNEYNIPICLRQTDLCHTFVSASMNNTLIRTHTQRERESVLFVHVRRTLYVHCLLMHGSLHDMPLSGKTNSAHLMEDALCLSYMWHCNNYKVYRLVPIQSKLCFYSKLYQFSCHFRIQFGEVIKKIYGYNVERLSW